MPCFLPIIAAAPGAVSEPLYEAVCAACGAVTTVPFEPQPGDGPLGLVGQQGQEPPLLLVHQGDELGRRLAAGRPMGHVGMNARLEKLEEIYGSSISTGENETIAAGPQAAVQNWLNSPGHRKAMLGDYTHVGIGVARHVNLTYYVMLLVNAVLHIIPITRIRYLITLWPSLALLVGVVAGYIEGFKDGRTFMLAADHALRGLAAFEEHRRRLARDALRASSADDPVIAGLHHAAVLSLLAAGGPDAAAAAFDQAERSRAGFLDAVHALDAAGTEPTARTAVRNWLAAEVRVIRG